MTFTYNAGVPSAGNKPSVDQPQMLQNTISNINIWDVNHYKFNSSLAGRHKKLDFPALTDQTLVTVTNPASIFYPAAGKTTPSIPQMYFKNIRATIPVTALRAFGKFSVNPAGSITPGMTFNVNTIVFTGPPANPSGATITLVANAVDSDSVVVMLQSQNSGINVNYTWSYAGGVLTIVLTFTPSVAATPFQFNFTVIQI